MHISKLHVQPHSVNGPKSLKLKQTGGNDVNPGSGSTHQRDLTSGIDALKPYLDELQSIPDVRSDFVEAARARVASGEYTTHDAAVETAASILNRS